MDFIGKPIWCNLSPKSVQKTSVDYNAVNGGLTLTEMTSWHLSAPLKLTQARGKTGFIKICENINFYSLLYFH